MSMHVQIQQRSLTHQQETMMMQEKHSLVDTEELERKITTFEEAMAKIKQATGVTDIQVETSVSYFLDLIFC